MEDIIKFDFIDLIKTISQKLSEQEKTEIDKILEICEQEPVPEKMKVHQFKFYRYNQQINGIKTEYQENLNKRAEEFKQKGSFIIHDYQIEKPLTFTSSQSKTLLTGELNLTIKTFKLFLAFAYSFMPTNPTREEIHATTDCVTNIIEELLNEDKPLVIPNTININPLLLEQGFFYAGTKPLTDSKNYELIKGCDVGPLSPDSTIESINWKYYYYKPKTLSIRSYQPLGICLNYIDSIILKILMNALYESKKHDTLENTQKISMLTVIAQMSIYE